MHRVKKPFWTKNCTVIYKSEKQKAIQTPNNKWLNCNRAI